MMNKIQNCFDRSLADLDENDNIGSYLRSGVDGDLITSGDGDSDDVANGFEGLDARAFMYAYDATGDNWDRLRINSSGELEVSASIDVDNDFVYDEDTAHSSGDAGSFSLSVRIDDIDGSNAAFLAGTEGDYQGTFTNDKGELYVTNETGNASLSAIETDIAAIEVELLDQGTTLDAILVDTNSMVVDLAAIEVELLDQGTTFDGIAVDIAAIEVELLDQGTSLDSILAELQQNNYIGECLRVSDASQALKSTQVNATTTQAALIGSAMANRNGFYVQNCGNRPVYIAEAGVVDAAAVGLKIPCGAIADFKFGASAGVDVESIGGTQDLRVLEYACS